MSTSRVEMEDDAREREGRGLIVVGLGGGSGGRGGFERNVVERVVSLPRYCRCGYGRRCCWGCGCGRGRGRK